MIKLHPAQAEPIKFLFRTPVAYATVTASRGFGKSFSACSTAVIGLKRLFELPGLGNRNIYIIGPTWDQTIKIYYPILAYQFGLKKWGNEHTGRFVFKGGEIIQLASYESIQRLRGLGAFLIIMDEVTTWTGKPGLLEAWSGITHPMMTTRHPEEHRGLIITTPNGHDDYYDMTQYESVDPRWKHFQYTYLDAPHLSLEEIERARKTLDPLTFAREYKASFEESGARVFYAFVDAMVVPDIIPEPMEEIHCSIDFNVGIQAVTYWVIRNDRAFAVGNDKGTQNTYELAEQIKERWGRVRPISAYPDPSGKARKSSAAVGVTDHSILQMAGITVYSRNGHPPIVDSVSAVNSRFYHGKAFVCRSARETIRSLDRTSWKEDKPSRAEIDKSKGYEHFSDGVRYFMEYRWPIRSGLKNSASGWMV